MASSKRADRQRHALYAVPQSLIKILRTNRDSFGVFAWAKFIFSKERLHQVVVTVVLVWVCGAVSYLEPAVVGVAILIGLSASLAAESIARRRHLLQAPQCQRSTRRAVSPLPAQRPAPQRVELSSPVWQHRGKRWDLAHRLLKGKATRSTSPLEEKASLHALLWTSHFFSMDCLFI